MAKKVAKKVTKKRVKKNVLVLEVQGNLLHMRHRWQPKRLPKLH